MLINFLVNFPDLHSLYDAHGRCVQETFYLFSFPSLFLQLLSLNSSWLKQKTNTPFINNTEFLSFRYLLWLWRVVRAIPCEPRGNQALLSTPNLAFGPGAGNLRFPAEGVGSFGVGTPRFSFPRRKRFALPQTMSLEESETEVKGGDNKAPLTKSDPTRPGGASGRFFNLRETNKVFLSKDS